MRVVGPDVRWIWKNQWSERYRPQTTSNGMGTEKKKRAVVSAVVEMGLAAKTTWLFLKQKYLFIGKMSRIFSRIWSPRHLWKFQLCGTDSFL